MKKAFSIIMVLILAFMVIACGSGKGGSKNTPPWFDDFPPEDVLWGIGTAKLSDRSQAMAFAENQGRVAIARQLDAKVQAMLTDYFLSAGNANNPASTQLKENVSRTITNMNVSGAKPIKKWEGPDGTMWYLLEMKKADAKSSVASILGNEEAAYAQFKAQQALDMLDAQLSKSEKASAYVD